MVKAAPESNRNGLALIRTVVIYGHVIWMDFISMFLQAVK